MMTRYVVVCVLCLLLTQYVLSEELQHRTERGARRKQKVLKPVPGCDWTLSECNPKKGRCGKGTQVATLTGTGCKPETKTVRCRTPCREEVRGPITGLSPSQAGLKGEAVSSSASAAANRRRAKDKRCKYTKGDWGPCDTSTNTMKRMLTLKRGDPDVCQQSKEIVKKCKKACKYNKGDWSDCNLSMNMKTRTLTLKKGDPRQCQATKTVSRRCKKGGGKRGKKNKIGKAKGCKYTRADWSDCDLVSNTRTRTLTLRRGEKNRCQPTITVTRKCKKPCKYTRGDWSVCNPVTNTRTRTLSLRKGDTNTCEPTKIMTRKCKKPCRYTRGQWSNCDPLKLLKNRVDQLKIGDDTVCNKTKMVTKQCKIRNPQKCKYEVSGWSDCDAGTKERTRTKTLIEGGLSCQTTKLIRRSCEKNNGEERCFFGQWGEFGECRNGVKTKIRAVVSGPDTCQRKAVKMKRCKSKNRKNN